MRKRYDWETIQRYFNEGHGFVECQQHFGFTHTAWIKAIKRGELRVAPAPFQDRRRRYDWAIIQNYYDQNHSYSECRLRFGFCAKAWDGAVKRGAIRPRGRSKPIEAVLGSRSSSWNKKLKLIREGYLQDRCDKCGLSDWRGKPLVIHIDHINGVKSDWRLENLRMLCPNCHSQTPTFAGRNLRNRKLTGAEDRR